MMRRLFSKDDIKIIGMYSREKGVVYATPEWTEHVAHAVWTTKTGKTSNIDYFIIKSGKNPYTKFHDMVHLDKLLDLPMDQDKTYGINYEFVNSLRQYESLIRKITRHDISVHTKGEAPESGLETRTTYVDEVKSKAVITETRLAKIDPEGKQDFHPICILDLNLDFAPWCMSGITKDWKLSPSGSCDYCYAAHNHKGFPNIYGVDRKDLVEQIKDLTLQRAGFQKLTRHLRLGKRVEVGYLDIFKRHILTSLEACTDTGLRAIMPTKFLEYDSDVSEMFKRTESAILISLGNDDSETGPVHHGRDQLERIEHGLKYLADGVNIFPFLLVDPTQEHGGVYYEESIKRAISKFPRVQFLAIRLRNKSLAGKVLTGWDHLVTPQLDLFGNPRPENYEVDDAGNRLHTKVHPSLASLIGNNNGNHRMCGHNRNETHCGMCFMPGLTGVISNSKNNESSGLVSLGFKK